MHVLVFSNPEHLAVGAADLIASSLRAGGPRSFGLSGGTTPLPTYDQLRSRQVPWDRVEAFVGDERWVPAEDAQNNAQAAYEHLFRHVPARLHRVPWSEAADPAEAASEYERVLKGFAPQGADLVLLGVGADGHTASLFRGNEAVEEPARLFVATWVEAVSSWRLTVTVPFLHRARRLVFLVSGSEKADTVRRVLDEGEDLPAARASRGEAEVFWLLDEAAAAELRQTPTSRPPHPLW